MDKQEYAYFLFWELFNKDHIDFYAFMELFKDKFGEYPYYDLISTFKQYFKDIWYEEGWDYGIFDEEE